MRKIRAIIAALATVIGSITVAFFGAETAHASNCYFTDYGTSSATATCTSITWPYLNFRVQITCWRRLANGTNLYDTNYSSKGGAGTFRTAYCDPYYVRSTQRINLTTSW